MDSSSPEGGIGLPSAALFRIDSSARTMDSPAPYLILVGRLPNTFHAALRVGWATAGRMASQADWLIGIEVTRPESREKKIPDHDT